MYTRGFVRNYATLLKLDSEALLDALDVELGQAKPTAAKADGDSPLRAGVIDGLMLHFSGVKWRAVIPIFMIWPWLWVDFSPRIIGATINPAIPRRLGVRP